MSAQQALGCHVVVAVYLVAARLDVDRDELALVGRLEGGPYLAFVDLLPAPGKLLAAIAQPRVWSWHSSRSLFLDDSRTVPWIVTIDAGNVFSSVGVHGHSPPALRE